MIFGKVQKLCHFWATLYGDVFVYKMDLDLGLGFLEEDLNSDLDLPT